MWKNISDLSVCGVRGVVLQWNGKRKHWCGGRVVEKKLSVFISVVLTTTKTLLQKKKVPLWLSLPKCPTLTIICYFMIMFSVNKGIQVLFNHFYSMYLLNTIIYLSSNGTRPLLLTPDIKAFNGNPRWLSTLASRWRGKWTVLHFLIVKYRAFCKVNAIL